VKICWARYLLWAVIAFFGSAAILSSLTACGQKGPLVHKTTKDDKTKSDKSDDESKKKKQ